MKRILVPVDFSPATDALLVLATEMARGCVGELHLVHVREIAPLPVYPAATIGYPGIGVPEMTAGFPFTPTEAASAPNEQRTDRLETLRRELEAQGLHVFAREREGAVVEEILAAAQEISADLIVMGSHGHGSVYNLLVGSVTEGVLKANRYPLLLVPAARAAK